MRIVVVSDRYTKTQVKGTLGDVIYTMVGLVVKERLDNKCNREHQVPAPQPMIYVMVSPTDFKH